MSKRPDTKTVTVHVPMKFSAPGGRKRIISDVGPAIHPGPRTEDALRKALAKAFRWRKEIEDGEYASITDLAKARGVNDSYACRLLRLTLLAPEIVNNILNADTTRHLTLKVISKPMPCCWLQQLAEISKF